MCSNGWTGRTLVHCAVQPLATVPPSGGTAPLQHGLRYSNLVSCFLPHSLAPPPPHVHCALSVVSCHQGHLSVQTNKRGGGFLNRAHLLHEDMPLVLLCGIPCSGKTRRAKELVAYLKEHHEGTRVHLLEDDLSTSRESCYSDPKTEKMVRAKLKSEVERSLTPETVVILDSPNYIKGYRYELYCTSKHLRTPHCVLLCETPVDTAKLWNSTRMPAQAYSPQLFDALVMRFEAPDSRNRWDFPLFVVYPEDTLPNQEICDALFHRKAPPPNQSTQSQPLSETNFLHKLDCLTQAVVKKVMEAQHGGGIPGGGVIVSGSKEGVELSRPVTMGELRRLRKQFISYTKLHPVTDHSKITSLFVQYLNRTII